MPNQEISAPRFLFLAPTLLLLLSCSVPQKKQAPVAEKEEIPALYYDILAHRNDTTTARSRMDTDSNLITERKYVNGNLMWKTTAFKESNLVSRQAFYENCKIKEEGVETSNGIPVDSFCYYNEAGKPDSVIRYDKRYRISYYKALQIAKRKGFGGPYYSVDMMVENGNEYWQFNWLPDSTKNDGNGVCLQIHTSTGKVKKQKVVILRTTGAVCCKDLWVK